jgi:hypothetical protein
MIKPMYIMEKLKKQVRNYQLYAGNTYLQYEQDGFTAYQNYLYKRALYGLDALTEKELATMCSKKKQRIISVYKRAQVTLNKFKQQVTTQYSNAIFNKFFPNSPITQFLLADNETDEKFKNTLTFKDLGIEKQDIIAIFIAEGILPKNFLDLKDAPLALPRLKYEVKA